MRPRCVFAGVCRAWLRSPGTSRFGHDMSAFLALAGIPRPVWPGLPRDVQEGTSPMRRRRVVAAVIAACALAPLAQQAISAEPADSVALQCRATPQPDASAAIKREEQLRTPFGARQARRAWGKRRREAKERAKERSREEARAAALGKQRGRARAAARGRQQRAPPPQAATSAAFVKPTEGRL